MYSKKLSHIKPPNFITWHSNTYHLLIFVKGYSSEMQFCFKKTAHLKTDANVVPCDFLQYLIFMQFHDVTFLFSAIKYFDLLLR